MVGTRKPLRERRADAAAPAPVVPVREREYTFLGDFCQGRGHPDHDAYLRQQAERYPPPPPPPEAHGPVAPQPKSWDGCVNGLWRGEPKLVLVAPKAAPPPSPAYDYNKQTSWRDYVGPEGDISMRPRGRFP